MSNFVVGSVAVNRTENAYGQSFTANVPGPSGSGSPGTATSVQLVTFALGFPTATTTGRPQTAYLHNAALADPNDIGNGPTFLKASTGTSDGSAFGGSSHTRTYTFAITGLLPSHTYYVYFETDDGGAPSVSSHDQAPYSGGCMIDDGMDATTECTQFLANFSVP